MKLMKPIITMIIALAFAGTAEAAPTISGVNGEVSHNQTVTISGSGFGSKSTPAPLIFDDVESGSFDSQWANTYDLSVNSSNQRHANSSNNGHLNFIRGNTDGRFTALDDTYDRWYVQYWFKLGTNWDWGTTDYSGSNRWLSNIKVFRMWSPGATSENFVVAINGWENSIEYVMESVSPDQGGRFLMNMRSEMTLGEWHSFQFEFKDSSVNGTNGEFRVWFDGEEMANETNLITRQNSSDLKRPFIIGFSEVWGPGSGESDEAPNDFFIDEVYMDNSWARVELGDQSTYASCTKRETQIPTSWSNSSIQIQVKPGSFSPGASAFVYVIDQNGNVNSVGYPVMVGGSSSAPIVVIQQPTVDDTYTVNSGVSTIDISGQVGSNSTLTEVTWKNSVEGQGTANNDSGDWMSWSVSSIPLFFGDNVITITAKDVDEKSGTDQITVHRTLENQEILLWSAFQQTGDANWKNSSVEYSARLLIEKDSIVDEADEIQLRFRGRSSGSYKIKKVSIAEVDADASEGDVHDNTWTKVVFNGGFASNWETDEITVDPGTELKSDPINFSFTKGKDYYVTFKIVTPGTYLNPQPGYRELFFESQDRAGDVDWSSNGHSITQDYHCLASIYGWVNAAPTVTLSVPSSVRMPLSLNLKATTSDDGNPTPPGQLSFLWSVLLGPGTVSIDFPTETTARATFSTAGTYIIQGRASDGQKSTAQSSVVNVSAGNTQDPDYAPPGEKTINLVRPNRGLDAQIVYEISSPSQVEIRILNQVGEEIILLENAFKSEGSYRKFWNGRNSSGSLVASGVYYALIKTGEKIQRKKIVLIK